MRALWSLKPVISSIINGEAMDINNHRVRKIGGRLEQKGSENLAKSSAAMVDPSNLGQPPRLIDLRKNTRELL